MTGNWQGYTNKMLFHSRLLLDAWVDAEAVAKPAFREACVNTMVQAYHSLLAEIMTNYQLSVNQLPTMDDAIIAFSYKGESSSELRYIEQLMQQDSWLTSLLKAHFESMQPVQRQAFQRQAFQRQAFQGQAFQRQAFQGQEVQGQEVQGTASERTAIPLTTIGLDNLQETESVGEVLESLKGLVTYSRNFSLEW